VYPRMRLPTGKLYERLLRDPDWEGLEVRS
jgi:hypothetical protein